MPDPDRHGLLPDTLDRLDPDLAQRVMDAALQTGADFAEVFAEDTLLVRMVRRAGRETIRTEHLAGASVRVISGTTVGTAVAHRFDLDNLERAARAAAEMSRTPRTADPLSVRPVASHPSPLERDFLGISETEKLTLCRRAEEACRTTAGTTPPTDVAITYVDRHQRIAVYNSLGVNTGDDRSHCGLRVEPIVRSSDGRRWTTVREILQAGGHEIFTGDGYSPDALGQAAGEALHTHASAPTIAAARVPVVLAPGNHGTAWVLLELMLATVRADVSLPIPSPLAGRVGDELGPPTLTLTDTGDAFPHAGALRVDDEGEPCRSTTVVDGGRFAAALSCLHSARGLDLAPTGNGRRRWYGASPAPTMTAAQLAPGTDTLEALLREAEGGIVVTAATPIISTDGLELLGLRVAEAYRIEQGQRGEPLSGVLLVRPPEGYFANLTGIGDTLGTTGAFPGPAGVPVSATTPALRFRSLPVTRL